MPISEEVLAELRNSYVAVRGAATIGQAIAALAAQGGQAWWHLIVQWRPDSFACTDFTNLYHALKEVPDAAHLRLDEWAGLVAADAIDQNAISTANARQIARQSPARLVVVTRDHLPIGIIFEGATRDGAQQPVSPTQLNALAGPYVNLKDFGVILLSSSKKPKS